MDDESTKLMHPVDIAADLVGGREAIAKMFNVTVAAVGNWKVRGVPAENCKRIEAATGGKVTCKDLRPDDWANYWPELATQQPTEQGA